MEVLATGGTMVIRPAKTEESAQLSELAQEAKRHWDYPEEAMDTWHSTMTLQSMHIDLSPPWVADNNGEVVGFYQLIADGDHMELEHLWVKPQHLQQGIGKQLLAHAVATAKVRGAKKISIDADANATAFYLSCGAYRVGDMPAANAGLGRAQQLLEIDLVGKV
jgi:N-acetylglutamate synthase-like GNAT family acetyltransferase